MGAREKRLVFRRALLKAPKPKNAAELAVMTKWFFGCELELKFLRFSGKHGQYEVKQDYNSYHGEGWAFGKTCVEGYDRSRDFWNYVLGPLGCGGIARANYGQFQAREGHRERLRIKALQDSVCGKDAGRVRKAFTRLAPIFGGGENTAILGSGRVLRGGRADGAPTASQVLS